MAEKNQKPDEQAAGPEGAVIWMPVVDAAEYDDDERMKAYPDVDWPFTGRSEEEVLAAAKKLPDVSTED